MQCDILLGVAGVATFATGFAHALFLLSLNFNDKRFGTDSIWRNGTSHTSLADDKFTMGNGV